MSARALVAGLLVAGLVAAAAPAAVGQSGGDDDWKPTGATKVASGLVQPVDVAFGMDGYAYYVELTGGNVRRVNLDTGEVDETPVATVDEFKTGPEKPCECGVFGLALHPDFHENGLLYVAYLKTDAATNETVNVLSRFERGEETVLLERPGEQMHNGGRIMIADGYLWWTTGDAKVNTEGPNASMVAQDPHDMRGEVMRLTLDGEPAPGNPWDGTAYTIGHRNVYGIAWDPDGERVLVTENGDAGYDEVNLLQEGGNHGWPVCEGPCDPPREDMTDPIQHWEKSVGPTGATWLRGGLWFGTFNQGEVFRLTEDADGSWQIARAHKYPGSDKMPARVLDVETGPDGASLWFTTWDELWRLDLPEDPDHPPRASKAEGPYWWEADPGDDGENPGGGGGDDGDGGNSGGGGRERRGLDIPAPTLPMLLASMAVAVAVISSRRRNP